MRPVMLLPIERLPLRYSSDWMDWFSWALFAEGRKFEMLGCGNPRSIVHGQFLDVFDTNIYKTRQLTELLETLKFVTEPLTIFVLDGWFPGIESVAYVRNLTGVPHHLCAILHAGTYDTSDYLYQSGCASWGRPLEASWLRIYDEVFVATEYHRQLLLSTFTDITARITVVDFPVAHSKLDLPKDKSVVFPHRLSWEKQPEVFESVRDMMKQRHPELYREMRWVRTFDLREPHMTDMEFKDVYYEALARASVVFSSALQETFGIAMLEGWAHRAWPVAPNRLAYRETLREFKLYDSLIEAVDLIAEYIEMDELPMETRFNQDVTHIIRRLP